MYHILGQNQPWMQYEYQTSTMNKWKKRKKNPVNKNQGWEPIHLKYKANENTSSRHNPKKKQKQTINKNHIKTLSSRIIHLTWAQNHLHPMLNPPTETTNHALITFAFICTSSCIPFFAYTSRARVSQRLIVTHTSMCWVWMISTQNWSGLFEAQERDPFTNCMLIN